MTVTRAEFQQAQAIAVLADRRHHADFTVTCECFGGGWLNALSLWPETFPYAFAVAPNRSRVLKRAPLVVYAADAGGLPDAIRFVLDHLDDVRCVWVFLLEAGPANELVRAAILADAATEGRA